LQSFIKIWPLRISISIEILGTTPLKTEKASLNTDFVVKEQNYLDNYFFDYNVNRVASTIYQPSNSSINIGSVNQSYGLENENSFAWNSTHSPELIERWGQERGKITYYVYSTINLELISTFLGANQLSKFLDIGLYSAYYITKFI
jgi:hypothetical protein